MAANLSDIAAMGARPVLATVGLGLAPQVTTQWVVDCYAAMARLAARFGAAIVGGDVVRSPAVSLTITVVGEVSARRLRTRAGARPGDVLAVTGPLGTSRAGLELSERPWAVDPQVAETARTAYLLPQPRVREGRFLAASASVHAMMDSSDGPSTDLARLLAASGCGALLLGIPVAPAAQAVAAAAHKDGRDFALHGGEDFELLVAVAPRAFPHLAARFAQRFGHGLIGFGEVEVEPGLRWSGPGGVREVLPAGWDSLKERLP